MAGKWVLGKLRGSSSSIMVASSNGSMRAIFLLGGALGGG
jgi:hypothetical protein